MTVSDLGTQGTTGSPHNGANKLVGVPTMTLATYRANWSIIYKRTICILGRSSGTKVMYILIEGHMIDYHRLENSIHTSILQITFHQTSRGQ